MLCPQKWLGSQNHVTSHSRRTDLTCFVFNENPLLQPNMVASDCFFYLNHLQNFEDERKFSYTFVLPLHFTTETSKVLGRLKSYGQTVTKPGETRILSLCTRNPLQTHARGGVVGVFTFPQKESKSDNLSIYLQNYCRSVANCLSHC